MRALAPISLALAACHPLPPAPMVASHLGSGLAPRGTTTGMVVVGIAGELLGGDGLGLALRVEHQTSDATTLGVELGGGRGNEGEVPHVNHHWLVMARGYGRTISTGHDWVGATYGVGASVMSTGMVTVTAQGGGIVSYPNAYVVPVLEVGGALAIAVRRGAPFGDGLKGADRETGPQLPPRAVFYAWSAGEVAVPLGDTGATLSAALALALALGQDEMILALSGAAIAQDRPAD